jgi:hypothetical protein
MEKILDVHLEDDRLSDVPIRVVYDRLPVLEPGHRRMNGQLREDSMQNLPLDSFEFRAGDQQSPRTTAAFRNERFDIVDRNGT